jgi:hypothetical protein
MIDTKIEEKRLYKNTLYFRLIWKGYSSNEAKFYSERMTKISENVN